LRNFTNIKLKVTELVLSQIGQVMAHKHQSEKPIR